jgi:hypothetical protein
MKKAIKLLTGIIIVYIMVYSCNQRLSSKYETNIRYNLEKEKKEKLKKEEGISAINPFKDTIIINSDNANKINYLEKDSKQKSLAKQWAEIAAADAQISEVSKYQHEKTTSSSQQNKSNKLP